MEVPAHNGYAKTAFMFHEESVSLALIFIYRVHTFYVLQNNAMSENNHSCLLALLPTFMNVSVIAK